MPNHRSGAKHQKRLPDGRTRVMLGVCLHPRVAHTIKQWADDDAVSCSMLMAELTEAVVAEMSKWKNKRR